MPLFEYRCRSCGREFEALVATAHTSTSCPACGSDELEKLYSSFGVGAGGGRKADAPVRFGGG